MSKDPKYKYGSKDINTISILNCAVLEWHAEIQLYHQTINYILKYQKKSVIVILLRGNCNFFIIL